MDNVIRRRATPDPDHPDQKIMRLAFTGYRPQKMPFGFDEGDARCIDFKKRLRNTIENFIWQGYRHFISGGAMGMDMYAAEIVQEEATIRNETEQKRKEILENASVQAQNMVNEASQNAQQIMDQANREANELVERASQEATARMEAAAAETNRMISDAEKKAQQLVEEESIVRRARVECEELRESARQEAAELHKNTLDYMDSLLAETDRKLSELINNIRLERNEIRNHR